MFAAKGLSCCLCQHKAAPEVSPLRASQPCALCAVKQKVSVLAVASCPGGRLGGGPWWPPPPARLAGRQAGIAAYCSGNGLPHSSSHGDDAALIDNNGKWQNRRETREGGARVKFSRSFQSQTRSSGTTHLSSLLQQD